jgi:hypothetical protein
MAEFGMQNEKESTKSKTPKRQNPCLEYQIAGELQWPWKRDPVISVLFLSEKKESGQEKSGIY